MLQEGPSIQDSSRGQDVAKQLGCMKTGTCTYVYIIIFYLHSDLSTVTMSSENCAIVVLRTEHILVADGPVAKASILVIGQVRTVLLAPDEVSQRTHAIGPSLTGATANAVQRQDSIIEPLADELVRGIRSIVPIGAS